MLQECLTNKMEKTEFSVSELSNKIKFLLENNFSNIKIKGEISGLKIAASGHGYFSLKDNNAVLSAICWRHVLSRINFKLSEGLEVVVTGKITAYAGQSKYQISVESIEPSGEGAFMQILRERRIKLQAEGLFVKEIKQKIPFFPKKIGIITSISGAVIKDIIHRISDRFPTNLVIWPVSVQGEASAEEVTKAINGFNKMQGNERPDLLIIARGGGSVEDLWSFNEEIVIRAAFACKIPLISAIGHETDYTLLDLVADRRAPTPTAAAEFAVPVMRDLKYTMHSIYTHLEQKISDFVKFSAQNLHNYKYALQQFANNLSYHTQKIDELSFRLNKAGPEIIEKKASSLSVFPLVRLKPVKILKYKYLQYQHISNNIMSKQEIILTPHTNKLQLNSSLLSSLDYKNTLKRGYAMIKDENGKVISSLSIAKSNSKLTVVMQDKELKVEAL